nr:ATP-binding protein [Streptomyces sp. S1D4-11]
METRRFVRAALDLWGVTGDELDSAVLVVSELAGNAAVHGRTVMRVSLRLDPQRLRVEVSDFGMRPTSALPASSRGEGGDEHGRGLFIVECLTEWIECRKTAASHSVSVSLRVSDRADRCRSGTGRTGTGSGRHGGLPPAAASSAGL